MERGNQTAEVAACRHLISLESRDCLVKKSGVCFGRFVRKLKRVCDKGSTDADLM